MWNLRAFSARSKCRLKCRFSPSTDTCVCACECVWSVCVCVRVRPLVFVLIIMAAMAGAAATPTCRCICNRWALWLCCCCRCSCHTPPCKRCACVSVCACVCESVLLLNYACQRAYRLCVRACGSACRPWPVPCAGSNSTHFRLCPFSLPPALTIPTTVWQCELRALWGQARWQADLSLFKIITLEMKKYWSTCNVYVACFIHTHTPTCWTAHLHTRPRTEVHGGRH